MYLFFDTETTGLPLSDFKDPNNPHITQLAWCLYNSNGELFKSFNSLIKPDNWEIPSIEYFIKQGKTVDEATEKSKFWIDNGFTQSNSLLNGKPIEPILNEFINAIDECKYLIAHNINFDVSIIASEFYRLGLTANTKPIKFCTMNSTTDLLKLPAKHNFKKPKLIELHTFLFNEGFNGAHDALADVKACAKCFFELKRRNLINLPI